MNKAVIGVVAVLSLLIAAGGGFWLGQRDGGVAVEAIKVARMTLPQGITAVGSLRSDESVTLRPEVAGRINAIQFREGERVSKGTLLVRLDPSVAAAEVE